jgi:hypothetical protein
MQVTMSMEEYQRLDNSSRTLKNVRACVKTNYIDIVQNIKDKDNPIIVDVKKLCEVLDISE